MALAQERPRVPRIVGYLSGLEADPNWTTEERAELQRRVIVGLLEADDAGEVI